MANIAVLEFILAHFMRSLVKFVKRVILKTCWPVRFICWLKKRRNNKRKYSFSMVFISVSYVIFI